jgi:hypothetical protein
MYISTSSEASSAKGSIKVSFKKYYVVVESLRVFSTSLQYPWHDALPLAHLQWQKADHFTAKACGQSGRMLATICSSQQDANKSRWQCNWQCYT